MCAVVQRALARVVCIEWYEIRHVSSILVHYLSLLHDIPPPMQRPRTKRKRPGRRRLAARWGPPAVAARARPAPAHAPRPRPRHTSRLRVTTRTQQGPPQIFANGVFLELGLPVPQPAPDISACEVMTSLVLRNVPTTLAGPAITCAVTELGEWSSEHDFGWVQEFESWTDDPAGVF